jgi:hypothetical protein
MVWEPKYTLEPSLWIHSPGSGMTLLLGFGETMSTVGWNVLGLQPVNVIFHKDKVLSIVISLPVYECISIV